MTDTTALDERFHELLLQEEWELILAEREALGKGYEAMSFVVEAASVVAALATQRDGPTVLYYGAMVEEAARTRGETALNWSVWLSCVSTGVPYLRELAAITIAARR